ncbi:HEAT domain containing protein [Rubidibacter lacunae KORDI 51-2]|uniref:HEAT domain containing protein n=1 Tax=Rubidibacter lacunae KORDI 51-2 TaxID=582515 RepID=U5D6E3_9CHRO|nr:HEAT repeat domain-containing protein [Rubidibacter lacunae]ERN40213.1 HEAT domain containing protein [Rubidibacter lacunae KORDI 51-2]
MSITPESVRALLTSEDFGQRIKGINQLRELKRSQALELILPVLQDPNPRIRYAAVSQMDSLAADDPAAVLPLLRSLLSDPEPDVQAAAADTIGALKAEGAFDDLQALYERTSEWLVRVSVIAALGELGDPRAFDLLQTALTSSNTLEQTVAIGSLGELGDPHAVQLLQPFVTDTDWQIRFRTVQALGRLNTPEARSLVARMTDDAAEPVADEARRLMSD